MIDQCVIIDPNYAKGGQKKVVLAEHPEKGKVIIKQGGFDSITYLERIRREIELLSELDSFYFPKQFDFRIDIKHKQFEIIEEFIEGATLRDEIKNYETTDKIFKLLHNIILGLSIIWTKNVVHRDLKPENIIIRPDGMPCIIDLGIARFIDMESLTKTLSPMGPCTPIYAAPEQLQNNKQLIDPRTDFFQLGIIVLELYLQEHPFDPVLVGNEFSIIENILNCRYATKTTRVMEDKTILGFASKTLQIQPYNRFRNVNMIRDYVQQ